MRNRLGTISTSILVGLIAAPLAASGDEGATCGGITLRVWNNVPAEAEIVRAAKPVVEKIFRRSGIEVSWIDCALDEVTCPLPNGPSEISLRIYRRPEAMRRTLRSAGGASLTDGTGARIVHVHYDRLEELRGLAGLPLEVLVGLTTAHEIGHLLLARGHSRAGIMRPTFEEPEWQLARQGWLVFTSKESRLLRKALCGGQDSPRTRRSSVDTR